MVASVSSTPIEWELVQIAGSDRDPQVLASLELGTEAMVLAVSLEEDLRRWLAAIGIARGDRVTVLRRAPFGGPIHLRTHTGGEFAVDRSLARRIHVVQKPQEQKGAA